MHHDVNNKSVCHRTEFGDCTMQYYIIIILTEINIAHCIGKEIGKGS